MSTTKRAEGLLRSAVLPDAEQYGLTVPRLWTPPLAVGPPGPCGCGCALTPETSAGFSNVDFALDPMRVNPFPWQRWFLIHSLELVNGIPRYRFILLLVARQNGKTTVIEIKNLWKLFIWGVPLILCSAQNRETAEDSWGKAVEVVEGTEELNRRLAKVVKKNGSQSMEIFGPKGKAIAGRWMVTTSSRRGGRGKPAQDVNLDELREHQNWLSWSALSKTTMAQEDGQVWGFSNAGDRTSVVLSALQAAGRAAAMNPAEADPSIGHFEYSAPDDVTCTCGRATGSPHRPDCPVMNRAYWRMANPSLGYVSGVTEQALISASTTDPTPDFLTECLCVSVPDLSGQVINEARWSELEDASIHLDAGVGSGCTLAVDSTPQGWSAISVWGKCSEDESKSFLQLVYFARDNDGLIPALVDLRRELDPSSVVMGRGTHAQLAAELKEQGIIRPEDREPADDGKRHRYFGDIYVMRSVDTSAACTRFLDSIRRGDFAYVPERQLKISALGGKIKVGADGSVAWTLREAASDIAPLVSATYAKWGQENITDVEREDEDYDPVQDIW